MSIDHPEAEPKAIGERLRLTRTALGLSQDDMARDCNVSRTAYNHWENGRNPPSVKPAISLCKARGMTLDWIFRGDPSGLPYRLADAIKALRSVRRDG